ncbi:hypothetical protein TNCV_955181 [Trichonephila clavipes]|nr:hypothetical protein TNCV_955181 [Trichonephila clavipes]
MYHPARKQTSRSEASTNWCKKFSQTLHKTGSSVAQYACYIISPKHLMSIPINFTIQHGIPSETTTYKSIDTVEIKMGCQLSN